MPNERLRSRMAAAGLTVEAVATHISVDPKTVARWIDAGRVPHRTHRIATARLLGVDEGDLWPATPAPGPDLVGNGLELVRLYPHRGLVPVDTWHRLFATAKQAIDVLVYTGQFLTDALPNLPDALAAKASSGVRVRLLLGDPDAEAVRLRGREEGIDGDLAARIRLGQRYLAPATEVPGVELRQHATTLYASIFRYDDEMLVNANVYGQPAVRSPVLHVRRIPDGWLFEHYLTSLEAVWRTAQAGPEPVARAQ